MLPLGTEKASHDEQKLLPGQRANRTSAEGSMSAAASPVSSTKPMTTKNQKAALVFSMEFSFPR